MNTNTLNFNEIDENLFTMMQEVEMDELDIKCGLNHGCPEEENPLAVDYFCQNMGDTETKEIISTIQIPICAECVVSLYSEYQILLICLNCTSSQWIFRPDAKLNWPDDQTVFFTKQCPNCFNPEGV